MFRLQSAETSQLFQCSSKPTKHLRSKSSTFKNNVSSALKRASRRISPIRLEIPHELCSNCVRYALDRSEDPTHDVRLATSLSLAFDGLCPQQELHVAQILGSMRESPRVPGQDVLHTAQTLSATAPLLLHPQLSTASLRHLEYVGGGQSFGEEVRAIERIYQLGPQLRSLRFIWGAGRTETFLDVTKFFCIAANTSSIRHLCLSDISRNIFEQFVATGLRHETWRKLQTLIWVPSLPHENDLDELGSPTSPVFPSSPLSVGFSDTIKMDYPDRPGRQSTASSWNSTSSAVSSYSAYSPAPLTISTSSRGTRPSMISDMSHVDSSFRIDHIGKDLMATFPNLRRFALWNWSRSGYDLLTRTASDDLVWMYNAEEIDEGGWLSI